MKRSHILVAGASFVHITEQWAEWGWTAGCGARQNDLVTVEWSWDGLPYSCLLWQVTKQLRKSQAEGPHVSVCVRDSEINLICVWTHLSVWGKQRLTVQRKKRRPSVQKYQVMKVGQQQRRVHQVNSHTVKQSLISDSVLYRRFHKGVKLWSPFYL